MQHQWTVHGSRQAVTLFDGFDHLEQKVVMKINMVYPVVLLSSRLLDFQRTHILVVHVPVGSLPIRNYLPHDDTIAPHVTGCGELPVGNGLWSRPPDGDLPSRREIGSGVLLKH